MARPKSASKPAQPSKKPAVFAAPPAREPQSHTPRTKVTEKPKALPPAMNRSRRAQTLRLEEAAWYHATDNSAIEKLYNRDQKRKARQDEAAAARMRSAHPTVKRDTAAHASALARATGSRPATPRVANVSTTPVYNPPSSAKVPDPPRRQPTMRRNKPVVPEPKSGQKSASKHAEKMGTLADEALYSQIGKRRVYAHPGGAIIEDKKDRPYYDYDAPYPWNQQLVESEGIRHISNLAKTPASQTSPGGEHKYRSEFQKPSGKFAEQNRQSLIQRARNRNVAHFVAIEAADTGASPLNRTRVRPSQRFKKSLPPGTRHAPNI